MRITCPHCTLAKEIDDFVIPAGPQSVTCPACGQDFSFQRVAVSAAAVSLLPALAGFWQRAVAALVDAAVLTGVLLFSSTLFFFVAAGVSGFDPLAEGLLLATVTWLFASVVAVAYYVFFTGYCGQTPGKMALRLKVQRVDGSDIGFRSAFYRETVGKFLSALLLGLGYLMVAFDERKQGLHDRIAQTYVIKL
ncbi:MAG TPA: hypothetical protein DEB35_03970 [Desulfuromonas sp.]|nr:hypothetical protein [Desulfuromonas sp.]